MKISLFTLGCKVNKAESDALARALSQMGHDVTDELTFADAYIVNTCAVTGEAEKKSRQTEARIRALNPNAKIIYTGCAAERAPERFLKSEDNLVTGVFDKKSILSLFNESGVFVAKHTTEYEDLGAGKAFRTRADVKVQDGCNRFCSYCIIPYLRGRSRSRSADSVLEELVETRAKEAVLNGVDLSDYRDGETDLAGLLKKLSGVKVRVRLGSLEARVITERFLEACASLYDFADHFHLSLQSGSDAVLRAMNRHYTAEEYEKKCRLIRSYFPYAGITTDVIAGYPTETEEDFKRTLAFVKEAGLTDIHPFPFSPREGTPAAKLRDLDKAVKKERVDELLKAKEELKRAFALKNAGRTLRILPETVENGFVTGYTGNYLKTYVRATFAADGGAETDGFYTVKIGKPFSDGVTGERA